MSNPATDERLDTDEKHTWSDGNTALKRVRWGLTATTERSIRERDGRQCSLCTDPGGNA